MSGHAAEDKAQRRAEHFYRVSAREFEEISGSPLAYWINRSFRKIFSENLSLSDVCNPAQGLATSDNDRFLRYWTEVSQRTIGFSQKSRSAALSTGRRWFPYNKGGSFRKWYGNHSYLVDWEHDGREIHGNRPKSVVRNPDYYFLESVSWSDVTSGPSAFRYYPEGFIFDSTGHSAFPSQEVSLHQLLALCNNAYTRRMIEVLNPTMHFHIGYFKKLPAAILPENVVVPIVSQAVALSEDDWNSYETSWDFTALPLLDPVHRAGTLADTYATLSAHWREMTLELQRLEEENNRIFIEEYGLQDELEPDVPLEEITLTCNPHYRYRGDRTEEELEALLLADTMREFISYAVGCMFGRYSLDEPGLILANQGDTHADYLARVPEPTFAPDENNVIPILDEDWFTDEITYRFRDFLRTTFGEERYQENLAFLEQALNVNNRRQYTLRDYFLKDFYDDHVRRYQKRPIYWLFSSPKGSFNALVYLHRYQPDTVSVVLRYLREYQAKLQTEKARHTGIINSAGASQGDKTRAQREVERLNRVLAELEDYERDTLYPLATEQVELDLDDGVKVNYPKLGKALKRVTGLS